MDTPTSIIILHGLIGAFGASAVGIFGWGFTIYITRLGTERNRESRDEGLKIMTWGTVILVVVMFLIGILRYLEG